MKAANDRTLGGIGGHQGFLSRAEGCWTFDARDRTPRPSRATAHHFVENALTQTPAPSRASGFVHRRVSPVNACSIEGRLSQHIADPQSRQRKLVFTPQTRPCSAEPYPDRRV